MRSVSRADARHQVAGALAAEVVQRQLQQVLVGRRCAGRRRCARTPAPAARCAPSPGPRPAAPSPAGRRAAAAPAAGRSRWPFWNGISTSSISGMVRYGGTSVAAVEASVSPKPSDQLLAVGPGKAPQPQQHPGRRRALQFARGQAVVVGRLLVLDRPAGQPRLLALEGRQQLQRLGVGAQREAPARQPRPGVAQLQACRRRHGRHGAAPARAPAPRPASCAAPGRARQQPAVGQRQRAAGESEGRSSRSTAKRLPARSHPRASCACKFVAHCVQARRPAAQQQRRSRTWRSRSAGSAAAHGARPARGAILAEAPGLPIAAAAATTDAARSRCRQPTDEQERTTSACCASTTCAAPTSGPTARRWKPGSTWANWKTTPRTRCPA